MSVLPTSRLWGGDLKALNWTTTPPSWETETVFQKMRNTYNFNIVRRHFCGKPVYETNTTYMNRMKNSATWCANHGMWFMPDLFSYNVGADPSIRWEQASNWDKTNSLWLDARYYGIFDRLGHTFKTYGNVILQLGNEPTTQGHLETMLNASALRYKNTITRLRNLGFTNWICIPAHNFGTSMSGWVSRVDEYFSDPKVMFDMHVYWWHQLRENHPNNTSPSHIRSYLKIRGMDELLNRGRRVVIGEFGVHGSHSNQDSRDRTWFRNMCTVLKQKKIDGIMQSFQPGTDFPGVQATNYSGPWWNTTPTYALNYFTVNQPPLQYYGEAPPGPGPTPTPVNRYQATTVLPISLSSSNQWRVEVRLASIPQDIISRITSATLTFSMWDVEQPDEVKVFFNQIDQGFVAVSGNETSKTYTKSISPGGLIAGQNAVLFDASAKQWGSRIEAPFYLDIQYENALQPIVIDTDYSYRKIGAAGSLYMLDRIIVMSTGSQVPAAQSGYILKKLATNVAGKDVYIEYKIEM